MVLLSTTVFLQLRKWFCCQQLVFYSSENGSIINNCFSTAPKMFLLSTTVILKLQFRKWFCYQQLFFYSSENGYIINNGFLQFRKWFYYQQLFFYSSENGYVINNCFLQFRKWYTKVYWKLEIFRINVNYNFTSLIFRIRILTIEQKIQNLFSGFRS